MARGFRRRLAVSLLLGLVVTLVVSVIGARTATLSVGGGYACDPVDDDGDWTGGSPPIWQVDIRRHPMHRSVRYWRMQVSGANIMIPTADFERNEFDLTSLPGHLRPEALADLYIYALYGESGWPLPATSYMTEQVWTSSTPTWRSAWTIVYGEWPNNNPKVLGLRPLWAGLIVNSLLAAAVMLVAVELALSLVRRRRRRAGRCRQCNYDLTGVSGRCPECGAPPRGVAAR